MVETIDAILPIVTLVIAALLTIPVFRQIRKTTHKTALTLCWFVAIFAIAAATVANLASNFYSAGSITQYLSLTGNSTSTAFNSSFLVDTISIYMAMIVVGLSAVVVVYSVFFLSTNERPSERYFAIMLMTTAGVLGAVLSGDLLTFFIFWEAVTAGAAFLMLYKKSAFSLNATLKYLVMVIIASAFVVFGLSIVYGLTGSLNYDTVRTALLAMSSTDKNLLIIAFVFVAAGYAIEAAIVPFHFWLPDAYTAAPAPSAAFLSALVDQGSYYILIRVLLFVIIPTGTVDWTLMLGIMAALTMIVGNIFALRQNNVKRLMAYICVADVGYNLIAITSVSTLGLQGNLYFFLIGGITTALAFMSVGIMNHFGFHTFKDIQGIGRKMPFVSLALIIATFSFVGVPPFGGFIAKYLVFTSAISAGFAWLAILGVIMSTLQAAYLFRLINVIYARKPLDETKIKEPMTVLIPIFILVGAIFVLGLFPSLVLDPLRNIILPLALI